MATNPWLEIPLEDYEGHMSAPQVAQLVDTCIGRELTALNFFENPVNRLGFQSIGAFYDH